MTVLQDKLKLIQADKTIDADVRFWAQEATSRIESQHLRIKVLEDLLNGPITFAGEVSGTITVPPH